MHLRKLEMKDAPLMLSWMQDESVVGNLHTIFASKTIEDCNSFIIEAQNDANDMHFAIVSEVDEYMGTVSLKHMDRKAGSAEFAIVVRKEAMGRGYSWYGMQTIIKKAFNELNLNSVYWCVSRRNGRAIRFYDKHHFHEMLDVPKAILERYSDATDLKWYSVSKDDTLDHIDVVAGCKVVHIKTIPTAGAGELSIFEGASDIPFEIKRIYYISKVPQGTRRGFHAHKKLKQLLFCPYGRIQLTLENENGREKIELSDPSIGVLIDRTTWREMLWLQKDSVLCVAASDHYDSEDYIRDHGEFIEYLKGENK